MLKNPWLAGLLNLIIPGAGYLYIGKRKIFATLLILATLLTIVPYITGTAVGNNIWDMLGSVLIAFAFAFDAYTLAQESV